MNIRERMRAGELLIGTLVTVPSPEVAEILCHTDLDWLFIDLEHSACDAKDAQRLLQACGGRKPCLVRVASVDEPGIRKALDSGAQGIILPQVNTRQQAEALCAWSKYPPLGRRSVGLARATGYGQRFQEYVANANQETAVVVQIEHITAVQNVDAILAVPLIDAVFIGPYDLSASMGMPGAVSDPAVIAAIDQVLARCRSRGVAAGIFSGTPREARGWIGKGASLIAVGTDGLFLSRGVGAAVDELKGSPGGPTVIG